MIRLNTLRPIAALLLAVSVSIASHASGGHENPESATALHVAGDTLSLTIPDPVEESLAIAWKRNGTLLANGGRIAGATSRTLTISDLATADAGTYAAEYQGHAKHGLTYEVKVIVAVARLPFGMGDALSLTIPDPVEPSLPIVWKKNGVQLSPGGGIGGVGTRTLFIPSLDHDHEGIYEASYEEHAKHGNKFGPYYVKVYHDREVFMMGDTVALDVPPPFVTPVEWFKNDVLLADGSRISGATSGALRIANAIPSDAGVYTAEYEQHHKHHGTHDVRVYVVAEEVTHFTGETFSLTIPEPVEPSLPITWFRDGVPLSNAGRVSGVGTPTLTISLVQPADRGVYWAEYEEHAKHAATLDPVLLSVVNNNVPVPGLPVAGGAGIAALCGALALAGLAVRRTTPQRKGGKGHV